MSSVYALDARKQCSTSEFWTFLISSGPRPLDLPAHALNKGTKRRAGASSTYFSAGVGHTHLKILQTMAKTRPHQESFENIAWPTIFCPTTQFCRVTGLFAGHIFQNVPECVLNHFSALGCPEMP